MQSKGLNSRRDYAAVILFAGLAAALAFTSASSITGNALTSATLGSGPDNSSATSTEASKSSSSTLQNGLKAYYRFDNVKASQGYSLEFDGSDDYVETHGSEELYNYSISVWFKAENRGGERPVFQDSGDAPSGYSHGYPTIGMDSSAIYFTGGYNGSTYDKAELTSAVSEKWYHGVLVSNGQDSNFEAYVNGQKIGETHWVSGSQLNLSNSTIGARPEKAKNNPDQTHHFDGPIDNVQIYNRSLTLSEVKKLYREEPLVKSLISEHKFDSGPSNCDLTNENNCLRNSIDNSYNGQPVNFTNNNLNTGSGWTDKTPINRPSATDKSLENNFLKFYGGNQGTLKDFNFDSSSGWTDGRIGEHALKFRAGSDRVKFENGILETDSVTVSLWVNHSSLDSDFECIICHEFNSRFSIKETSGNEVRFRVSPTGGSVESFYSSPTENNFAHYSMTYDSNSGKFRSYVNGQLVKEKTSTGNLGAAPEPLTFGSTSSNGQYFDGEIDDVRIYSKALSSTKIDEIYREAIVAEDLVGRWNFESGDREIAQDASLMTREGVLSTGSSRINGGLNFAETRIKPVKSYSFWASTDGKWRHYVKSGNQTYIDRDKREWTHIFVTNHSGRIEIGSPFYESGVVENVSDWTSVSLDGEFEDPIVIVSGQGSYESGDGARESRAIVRNIGPEGFEVQNVDDNDSLVEEDIAYLVMEKGHHVIDGVEVEAGTYNTSGSTTSYNWNQSFGSDSVNMIDTLQEQTSHAYSSRVSTNSLDADRFSTYWESFDQSLGSNADGGGFKAGYIAYRTDQKSRRFEGGINKGCTEDTDSGSWCQVNFTTDFEQPPLIFLNPPGTDGGDPSVGSFSDITENGAKIRIAEGDTYDAEQGHASVDLPWTVWTDNFEGRIDEFRAYNRSLSSSEIQKLNLK